MNKNITVTLKIVDRILGIIFDQLSDNEAIIITNGLSQKNVEGSKYCIYRQLDPEKFINLLGIKYNHLEQCMTNESHIYLSIYLREEKGIFTARRATINGEKLFHVEQYKEQAKKLFLQIAYFKPIKKGTKFTLKGIDYDFYDYFSILGERTGAHIPNGKAYYSNIDIKDNIYNHNLFNEVYDYFANNKS